MTCFANAAPGSAFTSLTCIPEIGGQFLINVQSEIVVDPGGVYGRGNPTMIVHTQISEQNKHLVGSGDPGPPERAACRSLSSETEPHAAQGAAPPAPAPRPRLQATATLPGCSRARTTGSRGPGPEATWSRAGRSYSGSSRRRRERRSPEPGGTAPLRWSSPRCKCTGHGGGWDKLVQPSSDSLELQLWETK